jgi:site-specific DNA-methyltransferase (adenine-specific)
MKPYYESEGIVIYNCDCREVLPELEPVDLVLTDPPYGMNWTGKLGRGKNTQGGNFSRFAGVGVVGDDEDFDPTFLLSAGERIILWGFHHFPQYLHRGSVFVWIKKYPDAFGTFLSDADIAWMNSGCGVWCSPVINPASFQSERKHPTQKPMKLMEWCIGMGGKAQAILDPFMGSGTTLIAAKQLGRKCIGIEIEEKYCEIAAKRLAQSVFDFT